ncbi:hypothetical protein N7501_010024 [Penicillium viridicatum]|nr:hypothetical protein N7501_010024 [Penicillium viridicatum]
MNLTGVNLDTMKSHSTVSTRWLRPNATAGGRFDPSTGPGALARRRYYQEANFDALGILRPVA